MTDTDLLPALTIDKPEKWWPVLVCCFVRPTSLSAPMVQAFRHMTDGDLARLVFDSQSSARVPSALGSPLDAALRRVRANLAVAHERETVRLNQEDVALMVRAINNIRTAAGGSVQAATSTEPAGVPASAQPSVAGSDSETKTYQEWRAMFHGNTCGGCAELRRTIDAWRPVVEAAILACGCDSSWIAEIPRNRLHFAVGALPPERRPAREETGR